MFNRNLVGDEFEISACSLDIYLIFCAPVLQVVDEEFGIIEGLMTTVHATTGLCLYLSLSLLKHVACFVTNLWFSIFSNSKNCRWSFNEGLERGPWSCTKHHS